MRADSGGATRDRAARNPAFACVTARRNRRLVTPWNNPLAIPVGKIAPALAFGNSVIWKPAPPRPAHRAGGDGGAARRGDPRRSREPRLRGSRHRALPDRRCPGRRGLDHRLLARPGRRAAALCAAAREAPPGGARRQQCRAGARGLRRRVGGPRSRARRLRLRRATLHRDAQDHRRAEHRARASRTRWWPPSSAWSSAIRRIRRRRSARWSPRSIARGSRPRSSRPSRGVARLLCGGQRAAGARARLLLAARAGDGSGSRCAARPGGDLRSGGGDPAGERSRPRHPDRERGAAGARRERVYARCRALASASRERSRRGS